MVTCLVEAIVKDFVRAEGGRSPLIGSWAFVWDIYRSSDYLTVYRVAIGQVHNVL